MRGPVIITRAEPGASETEQRLIELGYAALKLPALTIEWAVAHKISPPPTGACYIFTSANGVRSVQHFGWPVDRPAVCVGPATMSAAEEAGFSNLKNADGNADDVVNLICECFSPDTAPVFVHVANEDAAGDVVRRLSAAGFVARFAPLYITRPTRWTDISDHWPDKPESAVLLIHSAKAAVVAADWLSAGDIDPSCLSLVGVSAKSIAPLGPERFSNMAVALRPNEIELMKALQSLPEPGVSSG